MSEKTYMCIGGPLDGRRITLPNPTTKMETALDVDATYTKTRLWRRVEDYTTEPPTCFLQDAQVLICESGPLPHAPMVMLRLYPDDWREIPGTREQFDLVRIKLGGEHDR